MSQVWLRKKEKKERKGKREEEEVPIARILGQVLELPVFVENNVNAFAVAEQLYGAGRQYDHLMVIK